MDNIARKFRKKGIRKIITGTETKPRLNVFRSSKHIYASIVDDHSGKVIISVSEKEIKKADKMPKKEKAHQVGKIIAQKAVKKGFTKVVFDRAGYLYHGRVKELAEGAREEGLVF